MFCDEALDAVEPIAAGELMPDGRIADHLATCPNCAAALDSAKRLDTMLRARVVPRPTPQFTTRTVARVRRARWRSEQFLDVGFNVAIGAIVLAVVGGIWMLLLRAGVASVSGDAAGLFSSGMMTMVKRVAPSLPLYGAASAVLATALVLWWWAERDATL
jgi:predicted anti-sigma-YlaC factor YlaD